MRPRRGNAQPASCRETVNGLIVNPLSPAGHHILAFGQEHMCGCADSHYDPLDVFFLNMQGRQTEFCRSPSMSEMEGVKFWAKDGVVMMSLTMMQIDN